MDPNTINPDQIISEPRSISTNSRLSSIGHKTKKCLPTNREKNQCSDYFSNVIPSEDLDLVGKKPKRWGFHGWGFGFGFLMPTLVSHHFQISSPSTRDEDPTFFSTEKKFRIRIEIIL